MAAFIPLLVYMSDAVGTQMEALIIRDSSTLLRLNFNRYFVRQFTIITIISALLSLILFTASIIFQHNLRLSIVLTVSLFISIDSSVITGLILPRVFVKAGLDPANASGPIATIIQDILSISIYFLIASNIL